MSMLKKSGPPPIRFRAELRIMSKRTMADDMAFFGQSVGPRRRMEDTDPRNKAQKEDFCLRRLVLALVAKDRLSLPVTIQAPEADQKLPDFVIVPGQGQQSFGIEVTEAGSADWQKWLTTSEGREGVQLIMDNEDGYPGDKPERIVVTDIVKAIEQKTLKLCSDNYAEVDRCDLLIYENSEGGFMADTKTIIKSLQAWRATLAAGDPSFRCVHLLVGDTVHLDIFKDYLEVNIANLYGDDWRAWLKTQAEHLRSRSFNELDAESLADELESMARSDDESIHDNVNGLLECLLKWKLSDKYRDMEWRYLINDIRDSLESTLDQNPVAENQLREIIKQQYPAIRARIILELKTADSALPIECPITVDELRNVDFPPQK